MLILLRTFVKDFKTRTMMKLLKTTTLFFGGALLIVACGNDVVEEKQSEVKEVVVEEVKPEKSYVDIGMTLAMTTKGMLGKNLMGTIQKEGTDAALLFCNVNADLILDSMSTELNASIKRVTDKPRNVNNQANEAELKYINESKLVLADGGTIKPLMQEVGARMLGYYPITTNIMCMQCHGEVETQIKPSTLSEIKTLYPNDLAHGYTENELRGIWVVEFDK